MKEAVATFGHHPDADIDFGIEADALEGIAYEVSVGMRSQWPFWARLSRALRLARASEWFGRPDLEAFLLGVERGLTRPSPNHPSEDSTR